MLAPLPNSPPLPLVADDLCEAAFGGADPTGPRKYYRARYYDPRIGRFISEDPVAVEARDARELNGYAYVANAPTTYSDPMGLAITETCPQRILREVSFDYCAKPNTPGGNSKRDEKDVSCREAHCVVNCRITRECLGGVLTAMVLSVALEASNEISSRTIRTRDGWDPRDMGANQKGQVCGLRGTGWDCEVLCRGTR
jgi:RHS repeat-associated protein